MDTTAQHASESRSLSIYYLPGMAGVRRLDRRFCEALTETAGHVDPINWIRWPWLLQVLNLCDHRTHQSMGKRLADRIREAAETEAAPRVVLIGHSTGAAVVLEALAALPAEVRVEQAWLLAAAISRTFDLQPALRAVNRLFNVYSPKDRAHLWLGTSVFGTADRCFTPSAGWGAFIGPGSASPHLTQWRYRDDWRNSGYRGGHESVLSPGFARQILAPAMLGNPRPVAV